MQWRAAPPVLHVTGYRLRACMCRVCGLLDHIAPTLCGEPPMVLGEFVLTSMLRYPDLHLDPRHWNAQVKGCCKCYLRRSSFSPFFATLDLCGLSSAQRTVPCAARDAHSVSGCHVRRAEARARRNQGVATFVRILGHSRRYRRRTSSQPKRSTIARGPSDREYPVLLRTRPDRPQSCSAVRPREEGHEAAPLNRLRSGRRSGRDFEVSRPGRAGPKEHSRIFDIRRCVRWRLSDRRAGQRHWI